MVRTTESVHNSQFFQVVDTFVNRKASISKKKNELWTLLLTNYLSESLFFVSLQTVF